MRPGEFLKRLAEERLDPASQNKVNRGLTDAELEAWQRKHRAVKLPADLLELYRLSNGVGFDVNETYPDGYIKLLPLREVHTAADADWADEGVPDEWLVLSEHGNGADYAVLDTTRSRFLCVDTQNANEAESMGVNVDAFLDAVWKAWVVEQRDAENRKAAPILQLIKGLAQVLPVDGWRVVEHRHGDPECAAVGRQSDPDTFGFFSIRSQPRGCFHVECERSGTRAPVLAQDNVPMNEAIELLRRHLAS